MFDRLDFSANAGRSIGSMVTGAASGLTSKIGSFVSNLSGSGLGIGSLKNLAAKSGVSDNFLNGDPSFSRKSMEDLALNRSDDALTEINSLIGISRESQSTTTFKYPTTLGSDFLRVEFSKYIRPSPLSTIKPSINCTIDFPLPVDLQENHSVSLDPQQTGLLMAYGKTFQNLKETFATAGQGPDYDKLISSGIETLYQGAKTFAPNISFAGVSGEQAIGVMGQYLGGVPNPHISVFFNGVDVRPRMEFSWLFSPRNNEESNIVKSIIKQFKQRCLPRVSADGNMLMSYPEMAKITLYPWGKMDGNRWSGTMPIYKWGLIDSVNIHYSPNGLSFFNEPGSSPVFLIFSFTFQEIEIWTSNDYGGTDYNMQKESENLSEVQSMLSGGLQSLKDKIK